MGNCPYVAPLKTDCARKSIYLIKKIAGTNNAYLTKRKTGGGVQFSRDPYNLLNKHSRTHAGFINSKAVSVQSSGEKGVTLSTKKQGKGNTPANGVNSHKFKSGRSNQKYVGVQP